MRKDYRLGSPIYHAITLRPLLWKYSLLLLPYLLTVISSWIFENFTAKIDIFRQAGILLLLSKVDKYKTKSAAILLNFSPSLSSFIFALSISFLLFTRLTYFGVSGCKKCPFWPFSVKWLQVLVGTLSKSG